MPPADGEQRDASLALYFLGFFCFASFLPLTSDIPGQVVCLSLSLWWSWHGDVLCFALSVVSYQRTSQWGGSSILRPGSCAASPQTAEGMFCMVTGKWLLLAMVSVKWEQPQGVASVCTHSPCSAPHTSHQPGFLSAHTSVPWQSWCCECCFPCSSGVPGGLPWGDHIRHITV